MCPEPQKTNKNLYFTRTAILIIVGPSIYICGLDTLKALWGALSQAAVVTVLLWATTSNALMYLHFKEATVLLNIFSL